MAFLNTASGPLRILTPYGDTSRVVRGGSFYDYYLYVRCAYRDESNPSHRWYDLGFRVVASPVHL